VIDEFKNQDKFDTKKATQNNYNKMSKWYDLFGSFENRFRRKGLQLLNVSSAEKILEIGSGTGRSINDISKKLDQTGMIHGIDLSNKMISKASNRAIKRKYSDRAYFICGDAEHLPYNSNIFDGIFISFTIELFEDQEISQILNECKRVLKHEGRICIVTLSRRKVNCMVKIYEKLHKKMPKIIDCRPIRIDDYLQRTNMLIHTTKQMMMWGLPVDIVIAIKNG